MRVLNVRQRRMNLTPRAKQALDAAHNLARDSGQSRIGTEHLVFGLLHLGSGVHYGEDSLQSLSLAMRYAADRIDDMISKGWKFYFGDSEDRLPFEAYFVPVAGTKNWKRLRTKPSNKREPGNRSQERNVKYRQSADPFHPYRMPRQRSASNSKTRSTILD